MDIERLYRLFSEHQVVTTDSRDCPEGSIFFALKGESFDGNKFAESALQKGCSYAVIDEPEYARDERYIVVDDTLATLKLLARHHRRQFDIPVIGITGTNGKTTTKELVAAVLSKKYNVLYTQGNFNNDIGVPKTLLRLKKEHEIAVIEMGASHPGDIKTLVETVERGKSPSAGFRIVRRSNQDERRALRLPAPAQRLQGVHRRRQRASCRNITRPRPHKIRMLTDARTLCRGPRSFVCAAALLRMAQG